jgi:hypothetical protein
MHAKRWSKKPNAFHDADVPVLKKTVRLDR